MKKKLLRCLLVAGLVGGTAHGAIVVSAPWAPDTGNATEKNLYQILGGAMVNNAALNANIDQAASVSAWSTSIGNQYSSLVVEFAGGAGVNSFGIYDYADVTNFKEIYPGAAVGNINISKLISISGQLLTIQGGGTLDLSLSGLGTDFGFYLKTAATTYYSAGGTGATGQTNHMAAFDVTATQYGAGNSGWILAWEDLNFAPFGDEDYNDMVLSFTANPIPEPTTFIAGALLIVPFGASTIRFLRRRTA